MVIRSFITLDLAFTLYRSLIEPHLLYCNFILEGTSQQNKHKLQVHQNNALGAVKCGSKYTSGTDLHLELQVDSLALQMQIACCKFVYRGYYDLGPPALNNVFGLHVSERDLRSNEMLQARVLKCRTQFGERNLAYRGPIHWNGLATDIKTSPSINSFKEKLKNIPVTR